jgi:hypothetical protein
MGRNFGCPLYDYENIFLSNYSAIGISLAFLAIVRNLNMGW